jgi:cytoskeletal protein RodZ
MTPAEFRAARQSLGLSVNQMAALLEVHPTHVRHMEVDGTSNRRVMPVTEKLIRAYVDGYRPHNWPS